MLNLGGAERGRTMVDVSLSRTAQFEFTGRGALTADASEVTDIQVGVRAGYGLRDGTTIEGLVPFRSIDVMPLGLRETGIGDVELAVRHRLVRAPEFWAGAGVALPTGNSRAEGSSGERADVSLQPGRGVASLVLSGSLLKPVGERWLAYADATLRHALGENGDDYRFGAALDMTAGGSCRLRRADLFADLLWSHAARDERIGVPVTDSGGDFLFGTVGLRWRFGENVLATFSDQLLLAEEAGGVQMIPRQVPTVAVTVSFGP